MGISNTDHAGGGAFYWPLEILPKGNENRDGWGNWKQTADESKSGTDWLDRFSRKTFWPVSYRETQELEHLSWLTRREDPERWRMQESWTQQHCDSTDPVDLGWMLPQDMKRTMQRNSDTPGTTGGQKGRQTQSGPVHEVWVVFVYIQYISSMQETTFFSYCSHQSLLPKHHPGSPPLIWLPLQWNEGQRAGGACSPTHALLNDVRFTVAAELDSERRERAGPQTPTAPRGDPDRRWGHVSIQTVTTCLLRLLVLTKLGNQSFGVGGRL